MTGNLVRKEVPVVEQIQQSFVTLRLFRVCPSGRSCARKLVGVENVASIVICLLLSGIMSVSLATL